MIKQALLSLALITLAIVAAAGTGTLTADGLTIQGVDDYNTVKDREGLINDGSFEFGECGDGSAWTCYTSTTCLWIINPLPVWGYAAYDGYLCAWLGGFCGGPNENSFCQDIFIDSYYLNWYWMGYVQNEGDMVYITVDGIYVWQYILSLADHTYGVWQNTEGSIGGAYVAQFCGWTHNVCFGFYLLGEGSNMLVDYVTLDSPCNDPLTGDTFSTNKTLY